MDTETRTTPIPLAVWIVLGTVALVLGWFNSALGGWGLPGLVVGGVVAIPTLKYRRYWHGTWFWMTMLAVSVLQVPLVILARPLMDQLKFGFNLIFGMIDLFLVALVVNWVRPKGEDSSN